MPGSMPPTISSRSAPFIAFPGRAAEPSRTPWATHMALLDQALDRPGSPGRVELTSARPVRAPARLSRWRSAAAEAFRSLGDREVVREAPAMATPLAATSLDPSARERVRAVRVQWATGSPSSESNATVAQR